MEATPAGKQLLYLSYSVHESIEQMNLIWDFEGVDMYCASIWFSEEAQPSLLITEFS